MGDLHRHSGLLADPDDLLHRLPEPAVLAAQVAEVAAARIGGHPGQRHHLFRRRIDPGVVLETGAEAERPGGEVRFEKARHPGDLVRSRLAAEIVFHHQPPKGVVARVAGHVHGRRGGLEAGAKIGQRVVRAAVLPHHQGGDPLAHRGGGVEPLEEVAVGVAVGVDEPRREHEAARIDHGVSGPGDDLGTRFRNPPVHDTDGSGNGRAPVAVHDAGVRDGESGRPGRGAPREGQQQSHQRHRDAAFWTDHLGSRSVGGRYQTGRSGDLPCASLRSAVPV